MQADQQLRETWPISSLNVRNVEMGSQWWFCCVWFLCFALVICIYFFFSFFIQPLFEATSVVSSQPADFTIISGTLPRHNIHYICTPDLSLSWSLQQHCRTLHYKGGKHLFDTCLIKTCCHKRFHPLAGGVPLWNALSNSGLRTVFPARYIPPRSFRLSLFSTRHTLKMSKSFSQRWGENANISGGQSWGCVHSAAPVPLLAASPKGQRRSENTSNLLMSAAVPNEN